MFKKFGSNCFSLIMQFKNLKGYLDFTNGANLIGHFISANNRYIIIIIILLVFLTLVIEIFQLDAKVLNLLLLLNVQISGFNHLILLIFMAISSAL